MGRKIQLSVVSIAILVLGFCMFEWTINRISVPVGSSLALRYKGPLFIGTRKVAKAGHFAEEGEIGVRKKLRGPGRHFYCPIWWERTIVPDQIVKPGEVAIVRSMLGDELPDGQFLVDGDLGETKHKGILRKAFGPGRYRAHPYAYEFKIVQQVTENVGNQAKQSGWVDIPTGYVGVVTNLTDIPQKNQVAGIQTNVLPPGIYPINTREQQVDVLDIGYRETSVAVKAITKNNEIAVDEAGEPLVERNSGINFPSSDGFDIQLDFTTVWGVLPDQAAHVIRTFGNVDAVEKKVILPQTESICRNHGSQFSAVELLVGDSRQKFQDEVDVAFDKVLDEKHLTLSYGLIRHIYIPIEVRKPIQTKFISDELQLTRETQKETAKKNALLEEAKREVTLETQRTKSETTKMVAEQIAEGNKKVAETAAETTKLVAAIDKQVAELQSQAKVAQGEALAEVERMKQEAISNKFVLAVEAFGSGDNFNRYVFADSLPENMELNMIHAGEGTFWTDLSGFNTQVLAKQVADQQKKEKDKPIPQPSK